MILASEASNMGDHKGAKPPYRADKPAERVVSSSLQLFVNLLQLSINYFSKIEQSNFLEELAKLDIPVWQYEQSALCRVFSKLFQYGLCCCSYEDTVDFFQIQGRAYCHCTTCHDLFEGKGNHANSEYF